MVAEQARRTGVGRKLTDVAERWSSSAGAAYLALAMRRAASFYRALGYQDSATFHKDPSGRASVKAARQGPRSRSRDEIRIKNEVGPGGQWGAAP
jgi:GNAT superfamily N-acetyltransferase